MTNPITIHKWETFYKDLWTTKDDEPFCLAQNDINIDPLNIDELESALESFKNKKAPGIDQIQIELIKYSPPSLRNRLLLLLNECWKAGSIPEDWKEAITLPIFKRGDKNNCNNYRGISLLNSCYKLYAKILGSRVKSIMETLLLEAQHGFRKGRSCSDCIFTIVQLLEKRKEINLPLYIAFIDYVKAFDKVKRNKLWEIMKDRGFPSHLIREILLVFMQELE